MIEIALAGARAAKWRRVVGSGPDGGDTAACEVEGVAFGDTRGAGALPGEQPAPQAMTAKTARVATTRGKRRKWGITPVLVSRSLVCS